jgi:hypothetical protein
LIAAKHVGFPSSRLGCLVGGLHSDGLRVTDYFISHTSNEPFYAQQNLDPRVTLHVREVVLPGRERTVAQHGKVLLLIHGYSNPGYVAFDTDHESCSLMPTSREWAGTLLLWPWKASARARDRRSWTAPLPSRTAKRPYMAT